LFNRREVETHFAGELGLKGNRLQIDHYVATEPEVIEEQIDEEIFAAHRQRILAADECEPDSQFEQNFRRSSRKSKL
jgi:hypothetical protein